MDSDEFELKFPKLSRAELKGSRVEWSLAGAFQFSNWNRPDNVYTNKQQILVPNQNRNEIS